MGVAREMLCRAHDSGSGEFPCPWPECEHGCLTDTIERAVGRATRAYRRVRNLTDGRVWWTWQPIPAAVDAARC